MDKVGHSFNLKTKHPLYKTWTDMIYRCHNPKNISFPRYGARVIKVCDRGRKSIEDFVADVGIKPASNLSIDRINTLGNYEPENVRWATKKQQARNRRDNRVVQFKGKSIKLRDLADQHSLPFWTLVGRLREGHSPEEAVLYPRGEMRSGRYQVEVKAMLAALEEKLNAE